MKTLWARLGHTDAISGYNFVYIVVLQTFGSLLSALIDIEGRLGEFLLVRFAAFAVLGVVLGLGGLALRRCARSRPQPLITLLTFAIALTAGTYTFDVLLVASDFTDEYRFVGRLITAFLAIMTGSVLVSLLVTSAKENGRRNAQLVLVAEELVSLRAEAGERILQRHQGLIQRIREQITAQLEGLGRSETSDARAMRGLIDDVVRPLSYSLARTEASEPETPLPEGSGPVSWPVVFEQALRGQPFHSRAFPLLVGAIAASFLILNFGLSGLFATLAVIASSSLVTFAFGVAWRILPHAAPIALRVALFTLLNIPLGWLTAWIVMSVTGFDLFDPVRIVAWMAITAIASWTVALVSEIFGILRTTNALLTGTISDLRLEVAALNTSLRQLHKSISRILHGPIQEAITSVLMKLESQPELASNPDFSREMRTRIETALALLSAPGETHGNPEQVVADIKELWGEVVDISCTVSERDMEAIRSSQQTSYALSEVLREACQNAIRHGDATAIRISMKVPSSRKEVNIAVYNTGKPFDSTSTPGLGSQLFDDVAVEWSRKATNEGTELRLTLPLIGL